VTRTAKEYKLRVFRDATEAALAEELLLTEHVAVGLESVRSHVQFALELGPLLLQQRALALIWLRLASEAVEVGSIGGISVGGSGVGGSGVRSHAVLHPGQGGLMMGQELQGQVPDQPYRGRVDTYFVLHICHVCTYARLFDEDSDSLAAKGFSRAVRSRANGAR